MVEVILRNARCNNEIHRVCVDLVIQHAMRMSHIAPLYLIFSHYLTNGTTSLHTKFVLWVPLRMLSEKFDNLRRTERDMIQNV